MKLKHAAIHEYNLTAKEYNSDDFFHKDKVPFFGQKKRQHQSSQWIHIQVDRDNDWTKDWDDFDDEDDQFIINVPNTKEDKEEPELYKKAPSTFVDWGFIVVMLFCFARNASFNRFISNRFCYYLSYTFIKCTWHYVFFR